MRITTITTLILIVLIVSCNKKTEVKNEPNQTQRLKGMYRIIKNENYRLSEYIMIFEDSTFYLLYPSKRDCFIDYEEPLKYFIENDKIYLCMNYEYKKNKDCLKDKSSLRYLIKSVQSTIEGSSETQIIILLDLTTSQELILERIN